MQLHQQDNTHLHAAPNHTHPNHSTSTQTNSTTSSIVGQQVDKLQEHIPPPDSTACIADGPAQTPQHILTHNSSAGTAVLTPRQAFFADTEVVPLHAAVGRVSAELLCPYPPGVPVVFPGEEFSTSSIQLLQDTLAGGGVVTGGQDSTLQTVRVVAHHS
jgi:arginine/lysine/ornithine decarboxylase